MTFARNAAVGLALFAAACAGYAAGQNDVEAETAANAAAEAPKPAYMVVTGVVHDREAFGAGYAAKLPPLYDKFGGTYIAIGRSENIEILEGDQSFSSYVIGQWPSREAALAFWNSPEYEQIRKDRIEGGWGDFDVYLLDGLETPTSVTPLAQEAMDKAE